MARATTGYRQPIMDHFGILFDISTGARIDTPVEHPLRGMISGAALLETMRFFSGNCPLWPLHMERLSTSISALFQMAAPKASDLAGAIRSCLPPDGGAIVRMAVSPLDGVFAVKILDDRYTPDIRARGLSLAISDWTRSPSDPSCIHKTSSRFAHTLLRERYARAGYDEALFRAPNGAVSEGTYTNLWALFEGVWVTPPLSDGVLPGVMRRYLLEQLRKQDVPFAVRSLSVEELRRAEAIALSNAVMGAIHVCRLDCRNMPPPVGGRVEAFFQSVPHHAT